jgi:ribonuclease BN (tRNA processing enzyme)
MRIHFLGTNGWFSTHTGETTSLYIDSREAHIILDAGQGVRKVTNFITDDRPIYLFLSHLHLDHTYGFHMFPLFDFAQGITIIGQPGTEAHLRQFMAKPWTCPIDCLKTPLSFHEVGEGKHTTPLPFECGILDHIDPSMGYRLHLEGKTVTFCTDTGPCENVTKLGRQADLLITECAWQHPNEQPEWPHLAPEDAAQLATNAGAKQLALMHFDAARYTNFSQRREAERRAQEIFSNTRAMKDDEIIEV